MGSLHRIARPWAFLPAAAALLALAARGEPRPAEISPADDESAKALAFTAQGFCFSEDSARPFAAEWAYRSALRRHPSDPAPWRLLAEFYDDRGRVADASETLLRCAERFGLRIDWRAAAVAATRAGDTNRLARAAAGLSALAPPDDAPEERLQDLIVLLGADAQLLDTARLRDDFRAFVRLRRRRPALALGPFVRSAPSDLFGTLSAGFAREARLAPRDRARTVAALADALCAEVPDRERPDVARALVEAAAPFASGNVAPGASGLALELYARAALLDEEWPAPLARYVLLLHGRSEEGQSPEAFLRDIGDTVPPSPRHGLLLGILAADLACAEVGADEATNLLARAAAGVPEERLPSLYHQVLSRALEELGDGEGALRALERGVALLPDDPTLGNNLAYTLAEQGRDLDRALDLVDRALAARPLEHAYLDTLGWILHLQGRDDDALVALRKTLQLMDLPSSEVFDHVAAVLAALGRPREAALWTRRARQCEFLD